MFSSRLGSVAGGVVFLILALASLYRLLFWFPITVGGHAIGQTASFFAFAIFAALTLISFQGLRSER
jgi:hypothetical protein